MAAQPADRPDRASRPLFVGIGIPASVTPAIEDAIAPWRERFPNAQWVPAPDRHLTLKFLGQVPSRRDSWLHDRVREVAASSRPVELRLAHLGAFPSSRQARVLWVGIDDDGGRVGAVARELESTLGPAFGPERQPFTPHITVARSRRPLVVPETSTVTPASGGVVPMRELTLYRSNAGRSVPRYEALATFRLG